METEENETEQNILTRAVARTMARAKDIVNKSMKQTTMTTAKLRDIKPTPKTL
jgi:hypothetical protein